MRFFSLLLVGLLLAGPAMAQPDEEIVAEILETISPDYTSENAFVIGPGIRLGGETRPRASSAPGVCERDRFDFSLTRRDDPDAPPALEVTAERGYRLRAIESEPDADVYYTREYLMGQDSACLAYEDRYFFPVREAGLSEPTTLVWLAGQAMEAIAADAALNAEIAWSCSDPAACPSRGDGVALMHPDRLMGVMIRPRLCRSEEEPCFVMRLDETEVGPGIWLAVVRYERDGWEHHFVSVYWLWDDQIEVDD